MNEPFIFRLFPLFWLGIVTAFGVVSALRLVSGLRTGTISTRWRTINREEEPLEFKLAVLGQAGGIFVPIFMFAFGTMAK
jgi:hypothetical protein